MTCALACVLACSLLACSTNTGGSAPPGAAVESEPAQAAAKTPPSSAPDAPSAQAQPAPTGPASAGGLSWDGPAPLIRRAPKSTMRAAEYGVEGDPLAELTVFYFGPDQGGSVDSNITRWLGQIAQPDGSDTASKAKRTTREVGGVSVSVLEVAGAYSGGMAMPGAPAPQPIAEAMLLGAIASGPQGPVFFKLIGPAPAVEKSRAAFEQLISSLRK